MIASVLLALSVVLISFCFLTTPKRNTNAEHFDAILVLGTPAKKNGSPSSAGNWLIAEAVREYRAGKAPHVLISGAAVANQHVEADVLANLAEEEGIPAGAILEDRNAQNTLQNVNNSAALMRSHGWNTVEVIGLPEHLHRTGVLLSHTSLQWSTHPAPTPGRSLWKKLVRTAVEAVGTTVLRIFGLRAVPVLHALKFLAWPFGA